MIMGPIETLTTPFIMWRHCNGPLTQRQRTEPVNRPPTHFAIPIGRERTYQDVENVGQNVRE